MILSKESTAITKAPKDKWLNQPFNFIQTLQNFRVTFTKSKCGGMLQPSIFGKIKLAQRLELARKLCHNIKENE